MSDSSQDQPLDAGHGMSECGEDRKRLSECTVRGEDREGAA
jgi:hypothetical protein